ncbi:MAG: sugar ABC transporter permease [Candidatus Borkfalkiaceae bacterium]|nr:sugar ABC transporter permease [Christensenellaceae bacterium]
MRKLNKRKLNEKAFILALAVYPIIHFGIFWVYVNSSTIISTFMRYSVRTNSLKFCGFDNYVTIFKKIFLGGDPALGRAFINSFQAIGINALIFPVALFASYAFYKNMPGTKVYSVMFYIPQLISIVVLAMAFRYMFYSDFGPVAILIARIAGVEKVDLISTSSDYLWTVIWLFCIWSGLGSNVILIRGAMLRIPKELVESAVLDGCGFFRELWSITIPMCMSTISVYIVSASMSATSFTMAPMLIAKSSGSMGRFMTYSWFIFENASTTSPGTIISVTTMGVFFTIVNLPLMITARVLTKKATPEL